MKNFILKLSVILTFISAFFLIAIGFKGGPESKSLNGIAVLNSPPATLNPHTDFINAIFNAHYKPEEHRLHVSPWLSYIKDSLYFNSVQVYGGAQTNGSQRYGMFGQTLDTGTQVPNMKGLMDSVSDNQLKGIYGRINIEKMCYGQRLEYEISNEGSSTVNDGFCYQNVMSGVYTTDGVRTVLKPEPGSDTAGMLCENIYENFQHTDLYDFVQNDAGTWFVKPVMKIDSGLVDTDPAREIVRIKVINYTGDTIISVILRARNFLDNNGNYDGSYLDKYKFDFNLDSLQVSGGSEKSSELGYGISPFYWEWEANSKIDFKVEWLGQAEVWFDKMTVDDEISDKLFDSNPQANYDSYIIQEVESFTSHSSNYAFFTDELVYSNIPCVKYVKEKMISGSLTPKFTFATSNYLNIRGLKNDNSEGYKRLLEEVQPDYFSNDAHLIPADFPNNMPHPSGSNIKYIDAMTPSNYNDTIQLKWGHKNLVRRGFTFPLDLPVEGSFVYQANLARSHRDQFSPSSGFFMQPSLHGWLHSDGTDIDGQREPMNSEIQIQAMLAVAHGADGLFWFIMQSYGEPSAGHQVPQSEILANTGGEFYAGYGLLNPSLTDPTPRHSNMYGEDKWNYIKDMNRKLLAWKPYLDAARWDSGYSAHYEGAGHKYILEIESSDPNNSAVNYCSETEGPGIDCPEESFWEMGFFYPDPEQTINSNDKSKYFLMANRRCIPAAGGYNGDYRRLKIRFNSAGLEDFNNWKLIRLDEQNTVIAEFSKESDTLIDCGIFDPGEGRLYKLAPVMQEGGTLIADESLSGVTFSCNGDVDNNGKNITLYVGTNVNFANGVKWNIEGGEFKCGLYPESPDELKVNMKSQSGVFWSGLHFIGCGEINIRNTIFENVIHTDSTILSALTFTDCHDLNIYNCKFNFSNSDSLSCIFINFIESPGETEVTSNILYNEFNTGSNKFTPVICAGYAESVIPLMINGNDFNAVSGDNAIFLSNVSAGVIKNNTIQNYKTGVNILSSASYADLYNNDITGDSSITGAQICDGLMNLGLQGSVQTGGINEIYSGGANANNLNSEYGYFTIDYGLNTFNIRDSLTSYHLGGIFPGESEAEANGAENCFKLNNSITTPMENVVCPGPYYGSSCDVIYSFDPVVCAIEQNEDFIIVDLGNEVYDTIFITGGGNGAGFSGAEMNSYGTEITTVKELYNMICLEMRKRNYETVHTKCMQLITNYADSLQSLDGLSKLYLSSLILDRSGDKMSELKTLLESLILNHGGNEALVKKSYYLLQKTKVSLGLYQSAMSGFQQIMNQNPYSLEGLVAGWDYAATSLLDSMNGTGGGKSNYELQISNFKLNDYEDKKLPENKNALANTLFDDPVEVEKRNGKDESDKKISKNVIYTKEEKKLIKENIFTSFKISGEKKFEKVKYLQKKTEEGKATSKEREEFRRMKILSETVRARKPQNIQEHLNLVTGDIRKVFAPVISELNIRRDSPEEIIPTEYSLSQNYPNPFNPSTRINFSLPKDGRVKLTVYDILGREVKRLINNEFRTAGVYSADFNGSGLPSGVYFYKLAVSGADKLSGYTFTGTKKMVLAK